MSVEHGWNYTDRGEKPVPVPLFPLHMSCGLGLGSNQSCSGERPVTDHLSHSMAF